MTPTLNSHPPTTPDRPPPAAFAGRWAERIRRCLLGGGVALGLFLLGWGALSAWQRYTAPAPPLPDLTQVDPQVVKVIHEARDVVLKYPTAAGAWGQLGKVLWIHEMEPEALVCFRRAEALDSSDPRWPYFLGRGLRYQDPDQAIACLERAVRLGGSVTSPREYLGEMLLSRGRVDEAEALFRGVLDQKPDDPRAHLVLGRIALGHNDLDASLRHLNRSAALAPKVKATHSLLAQTYSRLDRPEDAERELRLAAQLVEEWGWPDPYHEEMLKLWVGQKARITIALDLWATDHRAEALQVLRALVADYPDSNKGQFLLGERLNQLEKYQEAEKPLRESIRLDPTFSRAHFELGISLHQRNRSSEAAACYREAIRLQPEYASAHHNLSICHEVAGDRAAAIQAVRTALRYMPDVAKAHRRLGKLLLDDGKPDEARAALERAIRLDPTDPEAAAMLKQAEAMTTRTR